jgi:hypothetical protein
VSGSAKITNHAILARWPPYDAYVQLVNDTILKVEYSSMGGGIRAYITEYRRVSPKCDTFPVPKAAYRDHLLEDTVMALIRLDTTFNQYHFLNARLLNHDWSVVKNNIGQRIMWRSMLVAITVRKNEDCFYVEAMLKQKYEHRQFTTYYVDVTTPPQFKKIRCQ